MPPLIQTKLFKVSKLLNSKPIEKYVKLGVLLQSIHVQNKYVEERWGKMDRRRRQAIGLKKIKNTMKMRLKIRDKREESRKS